MPGCRAWTRQDRPCGERCSCRPASRDRCSSCACYWTRASVSQLRHQKTATQHCMQQQHVPMPRRHWKRSSCCCRCLVVRLCLLSRMRRATRPWIAFCGRAWARCRATALRRSTRSRQCQSRCVSLRLRPAAAATSAGHVLGSSKHGLMPMSAPLQAQPSALDGTDRNSGSAAPAAADPGCSADALANCQPTDSAAGHTAAGATPQVAAAVTSQEQEAVDTRSAEFRMYRFKVR